MLKKLLICSLYIVTGFSIALLKASDVIQASTIQSSNSSISSEPKNSKKSSNFWGNASGFIMKHAISGNPICVYAVAGTTVVISAYSGYQLWRKFIFDAQLRAMREELRNETMRSTRLLQGDITRSAQELRSETQRLAQELRAEVVRSSQDTSRNITHEVKESEHRQMKHQCEQLQLLKNDMGQQINHAETRLANGCQELRALINHLRDEHGVQLIEIKAAITNTQTSIAILAEQQSSGMVVIESSNARIVTLLESLSQRTTVSKLAHEQDEMAPAATSHKTIMDTQRDLSLLRRTKLLTFFGGAASSPAAPLLALPSAAAPSSCQ